MIKYVLVSVAAGILFGVADAVVNANPLARRLHEVYKPIARESVNPIVGGLVDLAYGFVLAGVFLLLYQSLPGGAGVTKGVTYAVGVWFFRVVMHATTQHMMLKIPIRTSIYTVVSGLVEMLLLGVLFGLTLRP